MISRFLKEKCNILFAKESILIWSIIKYIVCSDKIICWFKDRSVTTVWNNWSQEEAQRTLSKEMTTATTKSQIQKFAYLTIKDDDFACFARAVFSSFLYISKPFSANQRFETTCFYSFAWTKWSLDDKFFFPEYFTSQATWNIRGIISKTQSYIIKFADDVVAVVEVALTHVSSAMFQWRPYVNISPIPEQLNWNAWTNCSYFTTAMYI